MAVTGRYTSNSRPTAGNKAQVRLRSMHISWTYCRPQKVVKVLERIESRTKKKKKGLDTIEPPIVFNVERKERRVRGNGIGNPLIPRLGGSFYLRNWTH